MSTVLQNAPALKLSAIVVGIVVVVGIVSSISSDDKPAPRSSKPVHSQASQKMVAADPQAQDTAAEDRARISAQMQSLLDEVEDLRSKLARSNNGEVIIPDSKIESLIDKKLRTNEPASQSSGQTSMQVNQSTNAALEDYVVSPNNDNHGTNDSNTDQNVTLDFSEPAPAADRGEASLEGFSVGNFSSDGQVDWVMPADSEEKGLLDTFNSEKEKLNFAESDSEKEKKKFVQYATIDKEAILYDAIVLTELVGVTAYSGEVTSPYYFKIELGRDNLMTSGIDLPHIAQMRMSGYAVGEWTTSCVQGVVTSATFVFEDGTISTIGAEQSAASGQGIGYITDPYGSPCIKGDKYSDLMEYASVAGGLAGITSIGEGLANAQFDTQNSVSGLQQAFTGSSSQLALGKGLSGTTSAITEVVAKRYENTRDIIIAPPGQYVTVQLTKQLEINYDPEGRKILNDNFEEDLADYYEQKAINGE